MLIICGHITCLIPVSNGPLIVVVKLKAKWIYSHGRHVLVLHFPKNTLRTLHIFYRFEDLLQYIILRPYINGR